jgi:hypothetical protein
MDPCIECPYCGLDLLGELGRGHDLFHCKLTVEGRKETQTKELEEIFNLEDPRPEGKQ